jgi:hypothetical protein
VLYLPQSHKISQLDGQAFSAGETKEREIVFYGDQREIKENV